MTAPSASTTALKLLLPLDGSRLAEVALPAAEAFARVGRVRATLVHIIEKAAPAQVHGDRHLATAPEAAAYLEGAAAQLRALGAEVTCHVHEEEQQNVARSIVEHADEIDADLVLMCSHGRGGLRDLLFGSIAQQALRWGRRSILLVPPLADGQQGVFAPRRLLVPLDGTLEHEPALPTALRLASSFGAELRLLLVIPTLETLAGEQAHAGLFLPATMRALLELAEQRAREYLHEALARCQAAGLVASGEIQRGDPVPTVLGEAEAWRADLLVLASHGRRGLDALFSGSVAPRLTGRFERPLLLVPAASGEPPGEVPAESPA
jgi:nucleotide-binding universal stress UspA family protein